MIFKEQFFKSVPTQKLYKSQMNGTSDATLSDFNPLTLSSAFNTNSKTDGSQEEFIWSYLEGAKVLSRQLKELEKPRGPVRKIFYKHSLNIPIIYLCRHCLELSIKYAIYRLGDSPKQSHKLSGLWSSFISKLPKERSGKEKTIIKNMGDFINDINLLDDTGSKLRYPLDNDGSYTQDKFIWVNSDLIVSTTEVFVKQLKALDIDKINQVTTI